MKPLVFIFLSLSVIFLLSSCGCKDKDYDYSYLDPSVVSYFGMYKTGSYWVYENQDKTKKDSIYVTSHVRNFDKDHINCRYNEIMRFTVKSTGGYLIYDSVCVLGKGGGLNFQDCRSSSFRIFMTFIDFYKYPDQLIVSGDIRKFEIIPKVTLNQTGFTGEILHLYNQDSTQAIFIQKQTGFIGYIFSPDTFNLVNYHLQL